MKFYYEKLISNVKYNKEKVFKKLTEIPGKNQSRIFRILYKCLLHEMLIKIERLTIHKYIKTFQDKKEYDPKVF